MSNKEFPKLTEAEESEIMRTGECKTVLFAPEAEFVLVDCLICLRVEEVPRAICPSLPETTQRMYACCSTCFHLFGEDKCYLVIQEAFKGAVHSA